MEVDPNKIIAEYAIGITDGFFQDIMGKLGSSKNSILNAFNLKVEAYLDKIYHRCANTKTLLYADKSVNLREIYTNLNLESDGATITDSGLIKKLIEKPRNVVVSGTAGCGKSMMMKYFVLEAIASKSKKLPVFFELRNLNNKKIKPLLRHLWEDLSISTKDYNFDRFSDAVKRGKFVFILDGFDELDEEVAKSVEEELRGLFVKYDKTCFIISSRPDAKLNANISLDVFHVCRMNMQQSINLISKVKYDPSIKDDFISEMKSGLFKQHYDFLSTPLLATMMLMTYSQFANVPEKIHLFYNQVYEVLYSRHDVSKEGYYVRDFKTSLPMDDFSNLFEVFSLQSYLGRNINFSQSEALRLCEDSIDYCKLEVSKTHLLKDLLSAVCLLVQDGTEITYSHRSFQEYFAALLISRLPDKLFKQTTKEIKSRVNVDDVLYILFGMQKDRMEMLFFRGLISEILDKFNLNGKQKAYQFLEILYPYLIFDYDDRIRVERNEITCAILLPNNFEFAFNLSEYGNIIGFIVRCFPAEFEWLLDRCDGKLHIITNEQCVFILPRVIGNILNKAYEDIEFDRKTFSFDTKEINGLLEKLIATLEGIVHEIAEREIEQHSILSGLLKKQSS